MLTLLACFSALVLAVTLHALPLDEDHDLAILAPARHVDEGALALWLLIKSVAPSSRGVRP